MVEKLGLVLYNGQLISVNLYLSLSTKND